MKRSLALIGGLLAVGIALHLSSEAVAAVPHRAGFVCSTPSIDEKPSINLGNKDAKTVRTIKKNLSTDEHTLIMELCKLGAALADLKNAGRGFAPSEIGSEIGAAMMAHLRTLSHILAAKSEMTKKSALIDRLVAEIVKDFRRLAKTYDLAFIASGLAKR